MDDKKEFYRLWWEYLRRSEKYQAYCKKLNDFHNAEDYNRKVNEILSKYRPGIKEYYEAIFEGPVDEDLIRIEITWGDVFNNSFENWWQWHSSLPEWEERCPTVGDFGKQLEGNILMFAECFEKEHGRQPDVKEIARGFPQWLDEARPDDMFISVVYTNPVSNTFVQKKIIELIDEKRAEKKEYTIDIMHKVHMVPVPRVRFDELKRYLDVYDLTMAGMKIGDIILKIGQNADKERFDDPYVQRVWLRYRDKAETIIANVEKGLFPVTSDR